MFGSHFNSQNTHSHFHNSHFTLAGERSVVQTVVYFSYTADVVFVLVAVTGGGRHHFHDII